MADPESDDRIRDLEQRMAAMPGSRIFVGLAEEYRRAGRYEDALNTLRKGLEGHPTYLSAQIALARLYQETWRTDEAIEAFSAVLSMDRENLVAAKALSDLYENAKNPVEAIKKLKLYRAISGDKSIDDRIGKMEALIHPPEEPAATMALRIDELSLSPAAAPEPAFDPNETVNILGAAVPEYPAPVPPVELAAPEAIEVPQPRDTTPPRPAATPPQSEEVTAPNAAGELPASRTLADLYFKQGFVDDARKIYEKLAVANPMDESVTRRLKVLRKPGRKKAARLESWLAGIRSRASAGRA